MIEHLTDLMSCVQVSYTVHVRIMHQWHTFTSKFLSDCKDQLASENILISQASQARAEDSNNQSCEMLKQMFQTVKYRLPSSAKLLLT